MSGYGEPESVSVAAIFVRGDREKEGSVTSKVDFPTGVISEPGVAAYDLGAEMAEIRMLGQSIVLGGGLMWVSTQT